MLPPDVEYDNYGKTLKIKNVDFTDEGNYDCDASNGVGSPLSHSVHLAVYGNRQSTNTTIITWN
jgi:hypothetical protein